MRLYFILIATLLVILLNWAVPKPSTSLSFLEVGQGDATLIQSGTIQILIDGGPGEVVLARLAEEMPWFDRSIEVVILTHPQSDHLEGLLHVLERYQVSLVLLPQAASSTKLQATWLTELKDRKIPYRFSWSSQSLSSAGLTLSLLAPFDSPAAQAASAQDINNASIITRAELCPTKSDDHCLSALLTGDAEAVAERLLMQHIDTAQLDTDILKAGHHGSKTSTSQMLINAASPAAAVISAGADNRFGHPHPSVLSRLEKFGADVWRTDQHGSVRFLREGDAWFVYTQK